MEQDPCAVIPHRPPALCIDTVLEVTDSTAIASRVVTAAAAIDGQLWEPWLIEGLAQTAAVIHGHAQGGNHEGMLVGVRRLAITRRPEVGETIRFHTRVLTRMAPLTLIEGVVHGSDETDVIAKGELKFYVEDEA